MPDLYPPHESCGACPFCGLRECTHDRTAHQGPFVDRTSEACAAPIPQPPSCALTPAEAPKEPALIRLAGADAAPIELDVYDRQANRTGAPGQANIQQPTLSAYDEPAEPPPTVVPITPKAGVERVLQVIEKRTKRKPSTQGSLF